MSGLNKLNPFSKTQGPLPAIKGQPQSGPSSAAGHSSGQPNAGDGFAQFKSALQHGIIQPNLNNPPIPPVGQGQRLFAMG